VSRSVPCDTCDGTGCGFVTDTRTGESTPRHDWACFDCRGTGVDRRATEELAELAYADTLRPEALEVVS
jgi:DnaJ-class molecular chaperone